MQDSVKVAHKDHTYCPAICIGVMIFNILISELEEK